MIRVHGGAWPQAGDDLVRHQRRRVAYLARPAALQHDAIEVELGMLALDPNHVPNFHPSAILFHGGSFELAALERLATTNLAGAGATAQFCESIFTSSFANAPGGGGPDEGR